MNFLSFRRPAGTQFRSLASFRNPRRQGVGKLLVVATALLLAAGAAFAEDGCTQVPTKLLTKPAPKATFIKKPLTLVEAIKAKTKKKAKKAKQSSAWKCIDQEPFAGPVERISAVPIPTKPEAPEVLPLIFEPPSAGWPPENFDCACFAGSYVYADHPVFVPSIYHSSIVPVPSVPEPEAYLMLAMGLGAVAGMARKGRA